MNTSEIRNTSCFKIVTVKIDSFTIYNINKVAKRIKSERTKDSLQIWYRVHIRVIVYVKVVLIIYKIENIIFCTHSHNSNTAMPGSIHSTFESIILLNAIKLITH
jgi:hypothetical protein